MMTINFITGLAIGLAAGACIMCALFMGLIRVAFRQSKQNIDKAEQFNERTLALMQERNEIAHKGAGHLETLASYMERR